MRPLTYPATFTVRTDAELRAAIDAAAAREGATASDWVRRTLAAITVSPSSARPSSNSAPRALAHG